MAGNAAGACVFRRRPTSDKGIVNYFRWSDDQRKMYAAAWQRANKSKTGPKDAEEVFGNPAKNSREEAAEKFNVSARGVGQAAVVIDHGCKQLQEAVRDGRVNVTLAAASAVRSHALHNAPTFADDYHVTGNQFADRLHRVRLHPSRTITPNDDRFGSRRRDFENNPHGLAVLQRETRATGCRSAFRVKPSTADLTVPFRGDYVG